MRLELDTLSPQSKLACPRCGFTLALDGQPTSAHLCLMHGEDAELMVEPSSWAVRMRWAVEHGKLTVNSARDMVAHQEWLPEHFHARLDAIGVPRGLDDEQPTWRDPGRPASYRGDPSLLRRMRNLLRRH